MRQADRQAGITRADVEKELERIGHELRPLDIVLVWTGTDLKVPGYESRHPGLRRSATEYLVDAGIKLIGIDAWGLDRPFDVMLEDAKSGQAQFWESHLLEREKEYCQIERLAGLDTLPRPTGFTVSAFPFKLERASAGWAASSRSSTNDRSVEAIARGRPRLAPAAARARHPSARLRRPGGGTARDRVAVRARSRAVDRRLGCGGRRARRPGGRAPDEAARQEALLQAYGFSFLGRYPVPNHPLKERQYARARELFLEATSLDDPPLQRSPSSSTDARARATRLSSTCCGRRAVERPPVVMLWAGIDTWKEERTSAAARSSDRTASR